MLNYTSQKGYIIQLYQYASRFDYNNKQLIQHFNKQIREAQGKSTQDEDYTALGDFDLLEINRVSSFRQYHDVSSFAKGWIGKRQCLLLYEISDHQLPVRLVYEKQEKRWESFWVNTYDPYINAKSKKFFCLSMFSLTNSVSSGFKDNDSLIKSIRKKILSVIDMINAKLPSIDLCCEVFGSFNTSEIAVIWLTDEYVDVLHLLGFLKHMSINVDKCEKSIPLFMTTFSVITMRSNLNPDDDTFNMKGNALLQFSFNDENADYNKLNEIKERIINYCSKDNTFETFDSVGEYDWAIKCSAKYVLKLICPKNEDPILHIGSRIRDEDGHSSGLFCESQDCRPIIRNNTRLLIGNDANYSLLTILKELYSSEAFVIKDEQKHCGNNLFPDYILNDNRSFYFAEGGLRDKLKNRIKAATGTVDTMDLLVTDYQSVISSTYNRIWAEDMHCQFYAVLYGIDELIDKVDADSFWESYRDITNSFKQQINHLTQSNRLFFEIPSSHLRATGHYDFLMHAYYGITKRIIKAVYLMQEKDSQSELVPLMTINTVPQVESELFFDFEKDSMRTMNLIIPNSVLTDPYRGIIYLCHEMFHYAVPQDRQKRNYLLGVFFLSNLLSTQLLGVLKGILKTGCPTNISDQVDQFLRFEDRNEGNEDALGLLLCPLVDGLQSYYNELKKYIQHQDQFSLFENWCLNQYSENVFSDLKSSYLQRLEEYATSDESNELFERVFSLVFDGCNRRFEAGRKVFLSKKPELQDALDWIGSRFTFYRTQREIEISDDCAEGIRNSRLGLV